jgi:hypothetical protein
MAAREIDRGEWVGFLDRFNEEHRGWRVILERHGANVLQVEAHDLPLLGISADGTGSEAPAIAIMLGDSPDDHIIHSVTEPVRLLFLEDDEGAHAGLRIESRDGEQVMMRFQPARRPLVAHVL